MAAGVAARALNAEAGDQGLRMRADATAAARTGGGIDFFGGNADAPASGLYVGATLAGASGVSLRMRADGKLQLRASPVMAAAAAYGIALRHDGAGTPLWTSDGITPTIEAEESAPVRDADADFTIAMSEAGRAYARHGDIVFAYVSLGGHRILGHRVSGQALVRDSRFDAGLSGFNYSLVVVADRLHALRVDSGNVVSESFRINAGSLTRLEAEDWTVSVVDSGSRVYAFLSDDQSKIWLATSSAGCPFNSASNWRGYEIVGGAPSRSAADDRTFPDAGSNCAGNWQEGNYLYFVHAPTGGTRLLRRFSVTGTLDATTYSTGTAAGNTNIRIVGFGGRVYVSAGDSFADIPYRAFRVEQELLQWDAPAADYATLNTRRQADSGFRVAVIDPDVIGASVPNARVQPDPRGRSERDADHAERHPRGLGGRRNVALRRGAAEVDPGS